MKRTNEAFKDEVFRRYRVEARNRRNLRIYIVSTLTAFLLVSGFAFSMITDLSLPELVASWIDSLHEPIQTDSNSEAPENPNTSNQSYDALSDIFEGQTAEKVSYWKRDYSLTTFRSSDSQRIASLITLLDQIPAETFDNRCGCGALATPTSDSQIRLEFENSGYCYLGLDAEHKHVYYHYYNPSKSTPTSVGYLRISDADLAKLYNFLQAECEALAPLVTVPSPEEYLSGSFHHLQVNGKKVNEQYNDLIVSQLKETLADLPLVISPSIDYSKDGYAVYFYTGELDCSFAITIYADDGLIRLGLVDSPFENYYYLSAASMELHELSLFLNECSTQEENPAMPSLEHYLSNTPSGIYCYESAGSRESFYQITQNYDRYIVEDFVRKLRGMNWTLVSEDIAPDTSPSDGIKVTLDFGIHIILEFDSSGRVLCKGKTSNGILITGNISHPIYPENSLEYDAVYSLPPEEIEEFAAYVYSLSNSPGHPVLPKQFKGYMEKPVEKIGYRMKAEQSSIAQCDSVQIARLLASLYHQQNLTPVMDDLNLEVSGPYLYITYKDGSTAEIRLDSRGYLYFTVNTVHGDQLASQWYSLPMVDVEDIRNAIDGTIPPSPTTQPQTLEECLQQSIKKATVAPDCQSFSYTYTDPRDFDALIQLLADLKLTPSTEAKDPNHTPDGLRIEFWFRYTGGYVTIICDSSGYMKCEIYSTESGYTYCWYDLSPDQLTALTETAKPYVDPEPDESVPTVEELLENSVFNQFLNDIGIEASIQSAELPESIKSWLFNYAAPESGFFAGGQSFTSPNGVDLELLLYDYRGIDQSPLSDSERQALINAGINPEVLNWDFARFTLAEVRALLEDHLSYLPDYADDLHSELIKSAIYLPETDCYYHFHTDTAGRICGINARMYPTNRADTVIVLFTDGFYGALQVAAFTVVNGEYRLLAYTPFPS